MTSPQYAKLNNGSIEWLRQHPYASNPKPETLAAYAKEKGYSLVNSTPCPGQHYTSTFEQNGDEIAQVWVPLPLQQAQDNALDEIQARLNTALSRRVSLPCPLGYPVVYDQDALINAMGMGSLGYCPAFIDAEDGVHTLNDEEIRIIARTLEQHRSGLYAAAQSARTAIRNAATVDDIEKALNTCSL